MVISADSAGGNDSSAQIALLDDLLAELNDKMADLGSNHEELQDQLTRLRVTLDERKRELDAGQRRLDLAMSRRRDAYQAKSAVEDRLSEIAELKNGFQLLQDHYAVDKRRLHAVQESGSLLSHVGQVRCPLCGAEPEHQHADEDCDGNVDAVVIAATAEIAKIEQLSSELSGTVADLEVEAIELRGGLCTTPSSI
jgi:DNA repair exonuclease SbcCD ATPase subunit